MDLTIFITRPISAVLLAITVATVAIAVYRGKKKSTSA